MKDHFLHFLSYFSFLLLTFTLHAGAEQSVISNSQLVRLPEHVPSKAIANAVLLKNLDSNAELPVTFILPLRNQKELEKLVVSIHNPADQQYGKYITSEEFVERFAPSQEDYDKVIAYTKTLGLTVTDTHPNRTLLNISGSSSSIEKAFNLSLHHYEKPNGRKFYAPDNNPEVPDTIASIISNIAGLDNHAVWHSYHIEKEKTESVRFLKAVSNSLYPSGPGGGYSPADLRLAYNLTGIPMSGAGQVIALFELAGYQASDINEYTKQFGLPPANLKNILVDGGSSSGIDAEVTLDIQLALALAPESQIYVYEGPNSNQGVLDTYNRIATDNIAKQVSTSWGLAENLVNTQYLQAENAIFLQMAAQGQTIFAAAGDSGAFDDSNNSSVEVDDPASQPYVVGVGGTKLAVNPETCAYANEATWNNGQGNGAGGGGVSTVWAIPSWQKDIATVFSKTHRNVPDVSLNADPNTGYSIFYDGKWTIFGGTSCAAPLWAAFIACVNQERIANQNPVLGFANPIIYSIAAGAEFAGDFHDIISGDNLHYYATKNYDNATGWGSFNGANLFTSLTHSSLTPPPPKFSPVLNITMTHNAPFIKQQLGTYQIGVANQGNGPTSGAVTVAITLPAGLTYSSFSGSGWKFNRNTLVFTRNNILESGSTYPTITLKVRVSRNAPTSVTTTATVSGGASSSSTVNNLTTIK